jgi:CheY-like chemotaxis protein
MAKRRILIIDDDVFVRRTLSRALATHDLTMAEDGARAIEILGSAERFDVILCDLMMPAVSGIDLYIHLCEHAPGQERSMVFLTGGAVDAAARDFLADLENPVIEKPFDYHRLRGVIDEILESR